MASIEDNTWGVLEDAGQDGLDPKTVTLRQASRLYREGRLNPRSGQPLSPYTVAEYARLVDKALEVFADQPLRSVTSTQVERWWQRSFSDTPVQASRAYTHLNTVMRYALERKWIRNNPCNIRGAGNYRPVEETEAPSQTEVALMLELTEGPVRAVLALAAHCGLRKGEILELRRKDISSAEEPDGVVWWYISVRRAVRWASENATTVGGPKSAQGTRALAVPKAGGAEEILLEHLRTIPAHPDTLLFSRDSEGKTHWGKSTLKPHWQKVRALAGYGGRFHSLRTYHLTWFAQRGATTRELMDRGGHSSSAMVMRYQRSTGRETSLLSG